MATIGTVRVAACKACTGISGPAITTSGCRLDQRCRSFRDHIIRDIKTAWDHKEVLSLDKAMKAQLVE
jgi:hypothetical protein